MTNNFDKNTMIQVHKSEINHWKRQLNFNDDDVDNLVSIQPIVSKHIDDIIDRFYDHIITFSMSEKIITQHSTINHLKKTLKKYLLSLFNGTYDSAYVNDRLRIGAVHEQVGLPLDMYMSSYCYLVNHVIQIVVTKYAGDEKKIGNIVKSILKIVNFDKRFAIEVYYGTINKKLNDRNRELKKANHQINEMIGVIVHDLRSPIGVISSFIDLILGNENDIEENREHLKIMQQSSSQLLLMVEDLLEVSTLESTELNLTYEFTSIDELIGDIITTNTLACKEKDISLSYNSDIAQLVMNVDPAKLSQALDNLISNSIKYSSNGTRIIVTATQTGNNVNIKICDQGLGIPEEELSLLFLPFSKTSVKPTQNETSTGLGLFIVKKIINAHHGEITVESEVGQGTTFTITLPLLSK